MGGKGRRGTGVRLRLARGTMLLSVTLVACRSGAGPADPTDDLAFSLEVVNSVAQSVDGPTVVEANSAEFLVSLPGYVTQDEVGRVRSLTVVWPDGVTRTSVSEAFALSTAGLGARATVAGARLAVGTYTLEVALADGRTAGAEATYDGNTIDAVDLDHVAVDGDGAEVTWRAPAVAHDWTLSLVEPTNDGATVTIEGGSGHCTGGMVTARVNHPLTVGRTYTLRIRLRNDSNVRVVAMQVRVGAW